MTIYHNFVIDISNDIIRLITDYNNKLDYARRLIKDVHLRAELDEVEKFIDSIIEVLENA